MQWVESAGAVHRAAWEGLEPGRRPGCDRALRWRAGGDDRGRPRRDHEHGGDAHHESLKRLRGREVGLTQADREREEKRPRD